MRKNEDKLIHKIGRGVVTGVMTTSLVLTGTPALLMATQTVAVAEGENGSGTEEGTGETSPTTGTTIDIKNVKTAGDYSNKTVTISDAAGLKHLAELVNSGTTFQGVTIQLNADIDLRGDEFAPIGVHYWKTNSTHVNHQFQGTFDGNGKAIKNFKVSLTQDESDALSKDLDKTKTPGNNYKYNEETFVGSKGLFGYVGQGGTVKDLTVTGANVSGANAEGAVIGYVEQATVSNVTVKNSTVSGTWENAGALIGQAGQNVTIENNSVDGCTVTLPKDYENQNGAGGLVGRTQGGITKLTGNKVTNTTVSAYRKAAGLIGYIISPSSYDLSGNTLQNVKVSINPAAKNYSGLPYNGTYVAEIQSSNNTVRGYETYKDDGSLASIGWFNKGGSTAATPGDLATSTVSGNSGNVGKLVNKDSLKTVVDNMSTIDGQIDKRRYSADTIGAFENALKNAQSVLNDEFATTEQANAAQKALTDAYAGIKKTAGISMFRLYNPNSGEHFYTASKAEHDYLVKVGWHDEGTGWTAPASSNSPVYRLYNPNAGDHHYTLDAGERDYLISVGWTYEGIGWFSDDAKEVPLYRQYNPNAKAGAHNFTTAKEENDFLVSKGWKAEGIGWYGIKPAEK